MAAAGNPFAGAPAFSAGNPFAAANPFAGMNPFAAAGNPFEAMARQAAEFAKPDAGKHADEAAFHDNCRQMLFTAFDHGVTQIGRASCRERVLYTV